MRGGIAFVIERVEDIERLLQASHATTWARWSSVTVIAVPRPNLLLHAFAPMSGLVSPGQLRDDALGVAGRVARRAVAELPPRLPARHLVCPAWRAPSFLAALRQGEFEMAMFATWPIQWTQRRTVLRAARAGHTKVLRVRRADQRDRRRH